MRFILTFTLLLSAINVSADMNCSNGKCDGVPGYIIAWPDGEVMIFPVGDNQLTGVTCTPINNGRAISLPFSDGQEKMYSMVLTAIATNKPIYIRLPDNSSNCVVQYIRFSENG